MTRRSVVVVLVGGVGLLVGLGVAWAGTQQGRSWVDAPLEPVVLTVGETLTVTAHSTDPDGVARMLLLVDEEVADSQDVDGDTLEFVRLTRTPTEPGTYVLSVWGSTAGGRMSAVPGTMTVTVVGRATTTTTAAPPQTTTTVACDPMVVTAPPLFTPANNATLPEGSVHFSWGMPGCSVIDRFEIQIDPSAAFPSPVLEGYVDMPATSFTAHDLPQDCLYWRVRALRLDTVGPWSAIRAFSYGEACG